MRGSAGTKAHLQHPWTPRAPAAPGRGTAGQQSRRSGAGKGNHWETPKIPLGWEQPPASESVWGKCRAKGGKRAEGMGADLQLQGEAGHLKPCATPILCHPNPVPPAPLCHLHPHSTSITTSPSLLCHPHPVQLSTPQNLTTSHGAQLLPTSPSTTRR